VNRSARRTMKKKSKSKLTDEQFEKFSSEAQSEYIKMELDAMANRMIDDFVGLLPEVLRANRISEERTVKILNEFVALFKENKKEAFNNEDLFEQGGN
jgi:ATP-dependent protease Clp ATPase subunit